MPATNREEMHAEKFLPRAIKSLQRVRQAPRAAFKLSTFLGLALLFACSFGCAPPSSSPGAGGSSESASGSDDLPEITDETIRERLAETRIRQIPEENGNAEPISWRFSMEEPKEITVVEKKIEAGRATLLLEIETQSGPKARDPRRLAGRIRTEWELQTGWALRRWEIVNAENVSLKYRKLPQPPAADSER